MKNIQGIMCITIVVILFLLGITFLLKDDWRSTDNNIGFNMENSNGVEVHGTDKVKVYISSKKEVIEINLEEYIKGVVSAEMPVKFNEEALKAQGVAARTYYFSKRDNPCKNGSGGDICDTTHCQVYMSKDERLSSWEEGKKDEYYEKISKAVDATKGEVLTYDGKVIKYPQFFATSSGKTESAVDVFSEEVPYLKSKESKGEEEAPKFEDTKEIKTSDFIYKINNKYLNTKLTNNNLKDSVSVKEHTEGGAVKEIKVGDTSITGIEFRSLFGLNSANFTIEVTDNLVSIKCKGYGHGLGMSQWGAKAMAEEGKTYKEILKYYYTDTNIQEVKYSN